MDKEYKDIKFSTLLKKVEAKLKEENITDVPLREFDSLVREKINDYFLEHQYPFSCTETYEVKLNNSGLQWIYSPQYCDVLAEIEIRCGIERRNRNRTFKSIVKSGPCFDLKVSELIRRREAGVSFRRDKVEHEAHQAGYASIQDLISAHDAARKVVDNTRWIKFRYEQLSKSEKETQL